MFFDNKEQILIYDVFYKKVLEVYWFFSKKKYQQNSFRQINLGYHKEV